MDPEEMTQQRFTIWNAGTFRLRALMLEMATSAVSPRLICVRSLPSIDSEHLSKRLRRGKSMTTITMRILVDAVESLKIVARRRSLTTYQTLFEVVHRRWPATRSDRIRGA